MGTNAAFLQAVLIGLINITFTIAAVVLIDRVGRRPLMLFGLAGVFVSLTLVAVGFHSATYVLTATDLEALPAALRAADLTSLVDQTFASGITYKSALADLIGLDALRENEAALISYALNGNPMIILFGILGFVASFAVSLGPVMWVFLSEIFPSHVRGVAIALVTVFNSTSSWLVQFLFPIQIATTGIAGVFALYATFALIGLGLVWFLMPETKAMTLEAVSQTLARRWRRKPPA